MTSNVYTKNEILQNLASQGQFIDAYTLDNFLQKYQIEAIFEDEQGSEFFDKNTLDFIVKSFSKTTENQKPDIVEEQQDFQQPQEEVTTYNPLGQQYSQQIPLDNETNDILNNISLSDGSSLMENVQNSNINDFSNISTIDEPQFDSNIPSEEPFDFSIQKERKVGILEGAMIASGQEFEPEIQPAQIINPASQMIEDEEDFDDISLLSESYEAQEKFREYVVSELSKKNMDLTPKSNEFKLDISEKTLNMVARAVAKKIAKHVSQICMQDARSGAKLNEVEEKNKKLEKKLKELDEQNKKLRLLLVESNKNLNSYKPSILGLYKKVKPEKQ